MLRVISRRLGLFCALLRVALSLAMEVVKGRLGRCYASRACPALLLEVLEFRGLW